MCESLEQYGVLWDQHVYSQCCHCFQF